MTAVEFLHSEYKRILGEINPSTAQLYEIAYALEQAKQMEKEQIIDAYNISWKLRDKPYATAEKYYKETFKSE